MPEVPDIFEEFEQDCRTPVGDLGDCSICPAALHCQAEIDRHRGIQRVTLTRAVGSANCDSAVAWIDEWEQKAQAGEAYLGQLTKACVGPVSLHVIRGPSQVAVTVCMSPLMPNGDSCEPSHVYRDTKK
ncbi:MAG: hypothetical protein ABI221_01260 [Candidatus Saccharimonadales bacterium]